jgi:hypothetical protein
MSQYVQWLKSANESILHPAAIDFMRSLPDSMFLGTSVFALFTQSFPLGILVLAMLEFTLLHRVFGGTASYIQSGNEQSPKDYKCIPGIPSPYQISIVGKLISQHAFPSGPMMFVASVLSYTILSIYNFSNELKELSQQEPQWNTRIPVSITFCCLLLVFYMLWRYNTECDSAMNVLASSIIGLIVGGVVCLVHQFLFGRFAINFLGIPILADRAAEGRPLYVCAKTKTN